MSDPTFYIDDEVNRAFEARINGKLYAISAATISVWRPDDSKQVNGATMTIAGTRATYQIAGSVNNAAGTYTVEADITFANSQGQLSISETYVVTARKA